MSQGSDLDKWADFAVGTREASLTDPGEIINQATRYRNHMYVTMLNGLSKDIYIQAGAKIVTHVLFDYTSSFSNYNPTDSFNYTDSSSLTRLELPWRFTKVSSVISQFELLLNGNDRETTFVNVKKSKETVRNMDWWEGHEDNFWALPNYETMESPTLSGTGAPYSLRCFITNDGLAPSSTNGGVASADFSTLMTANPSSKVNFRNQVTSFTNTNDTTRRAANGGVISAMDKLWLKCRYKAPDASSGQTIKETKNRILCNLLSQQLYTSIIRASNNVLSPMNDPGYPNGDAVFHGIPVEYVDKLNSIDTDAADPTTAPDGQADDGSGKKGYAFWYPNFEYIHPVFHRQKYRDLIKLDGGAKQPHMRVLFEDTFENLICTNRRVQGKCIAA